MHDKWQMNMEELLGTAAEYIVGNPHKKHNVMYTTALSGHHALNKRTPTAEKLIPTEYWRIRLSKRQALR